MSRNSKLREVAAKLPPLPVVRNGYLVSDRGNGAGNTIMVDHFREMCKMKDALPQPKLDYSQLDKIVNTKLRHQAKRKLKDAYWKAHHKMEIQVIGTYTDSVLTAVRKRRNKRIATVLKWGSSAVSLSLAGLYWWLRRK